MRICKWVGLITGFCQAVPYPEDEAADCKNDHCSTKNRTNNNSSNDASAERRGLSPCRLFIGGTCACYVDSGSDAVDLDVGSRNSPKALEDCAKQIHILQAKQSNVALQAIVIQISQI